MVAFWRDIGLVDEDTSQKTAWKIQLVRGLFPRLEEECSAVAQYYLRSARPTGLEAESAVVQYVLDEYTDFHLRTPIFDDLWAVPYVQGNLARCGINLRRWAALCVGTEWRIWLRRILPHEMWPDAVETFFRRHGLQVVELDEEMREALA